MRVSPAVARGGVVKLAELDKVDVAVVVEVKLVEEVLRLLRRHVQAGERGL